MAQAPQQQAWGSAAPGGNFRLQPGPAQPQQNGGIGAYGGQQQMAGGGAGPTGWAPGRRNTPGAPGAASGEHGQQQNSIWGSQSNLAVMHSQNADGRCALAWAALAQRKA